MNPMFVNAKPFIPMLPTMVVPTLYSPPTTTTRPFGSKAEAKKRGAYMHGVAAVHGVPTPVIVLKTSRRVSTAFGMGGMEPGTSHVPLR